MSPGTPSGWLRRQLHVSADRLLVRRVIGRLEAKLGSNTVRELCRRITRLLAADGHLASGLDPEREARHLQALIDGRAVEGLVGRLDKVEMLRRLSPSA